MQLYTGMAIFNEKSLQGKFTDVVVKDDSISFDVSYYGNSYTVSLKKKQGSLYKGIATHQQTRTEISLTARVVVDHEADLIIISGSEWREEGKEWVWFAEISAL